MTELQECLLSIAAGAGLSLTGFVLVVGLLEAKARRARRRGVSDADQA